MAIGAINQTTYKQLSAANSQSSEANCGLFLNIVTCEKSSIKEHTETIPRFLTTPQLLFYNKRSLF